MASKCQRAIGRARPAGVHRTRCCACDQRRVGCRWSARRTTAVRSWPPPARSRPGSIGLRPMRSDRRRTATNSGAASASAAQSSRLARARVAPAAARSGRTAPGTAPCTRPPPARRPGRTARSTPAAGWASARRPRPAACATRRPIASAARNSGDSCRLRRTQTPIASSTQRQQERQPPAPVGKRLLRPASCAAPTMTSQRQQQAEADAVVWIQPV